MRFVWTISFVLLMPLSVYAQEHCAMEKCHGLDVSCAVVKGPRACPAIYELGDFCRKYVKCEMKDGRCQLAKEQKFDTCVACVDACRKRTKEENPFDCELQCRAKMEQENVLNTEDEAPFASREDLVQALEATVKAKDASRFSRFYCWWGVDGSTKEQTLSALSVFLKTQVISISLSDLPEEFQPENVVGNVRYRPNVTPVGLVNIVYFDQATGSEIGSVIPYAEVDGGYCLVSTVREVITENH